jgi:catechol 2,3-dioxygenase-like lactoylglutathione lyase family enzyme
MLAAAKLIAFAATTHPPRAKIFYHEILGLPLLSEDDFALVFDAHGTTLRVAVVQHATIAPYTVLGWEVPDVAAAVQQLKDKGVHTERFPGMPQDELGIWQAPSGARVAWFKDPEGNLLSVSQG